MFPLYRKYSFRQAASVRRPPGRASSHRRGPEPKTACTFDLKPLQTRDGMELRRGQGGGFDERGKPLEDDALNVVWVVDSEALPFYRAEKYHQVRGWKICPWLMRVGTLTLRCGVHGSRCSP